MKAKTVMTIMMCLGLNTALLAATRIWPEQGAKDWDAPDALWESAPGVPASPPGISDFAYILSSNEITVDSIVPTVRRLYVDRSVSGYTTVPSMISILPGGQLTVDSICQLGYSIDGGTINVAGGEFIIAGTDRSGSFALRVENDHAGILSVTDGILSVRNGSLFVFEDDSQGLVTVSGDGLIEFLGGSQFDMGAGALGVTISDGGLIMFDETDASAEIQALAEAGQLTGVLPLATPLYTPDGSANGVGWYYDGNDTYAFTVIPEPATLFLLGLGSLALAKRRK